MPISFPTRLSNLLSGSAYEPPLQVLAGCVSTVVSASGVPFFPGYTDHGVDHINDVLASAVKLVPEELWADRNGADEPLLTAADAAVLIGATLLHDIAMHLDTAGFLELVGRDSRFKPLPWFDRAQEDHAPDRPWFDLWDDYEREARRFDARTAGNLFGEAAASGYVFAGIKALSGPLNDNDRLVVGEFIRRHHARLAHEIAIRGFPGLPTTGQGSFPAMGVDDGHGLHDLADLIGLTARSHWLSMRVCKAYLDHDTRYKGKPRPLGTAALYPMALLRVADYLQIDRKRAPAVLLQLKRPPSPVSVGEWLKHQAVAEVAEANDPRGYMITVSDKVPLTQYLSLRDLVRDLQAEMDHATAVLDEFYGNQTRLGLDRLTLAKRRVHTNLHDPDFRASLPYLPESIGYTMDPRLLSLLVEPLYGPNPGIGVRELMQNSVDAVRELHAWCERHGRRVEDLDLPDQEADVLIDFIEQDDGSWLLRVTDKGIGMTAETIRDHFLRAGSSYRFSREWGEEFVGEDGAPRVVRSGQFGIGAFATFLLGDSFTVRTRHVTAGPDEGWEFCGGRDSNALEIQRVTSLPLGTTTDVRLAKEAATALGLTGGKHMARHEPNGDTDWYCLDWPTVVRRARRGLKTTECPPRWSYSSPGSDTEPEWSEIGSDASHSVRWTFDEKAPALTCNGVVVQTRWGRDEPWWPLKCRLPQVLVMDLERSLKLTMTRCRLAGAPPFAAALASDVACSFVAHALVCAPAEPGQPLASPHPLFASFHDGYEDGRVRWCFSPAGMILDEAALLSCLDADWVARVGAEPSAPSLPRVRHAADHDRLACVDGGRAPFDGNAWHLALSIHRAMEGREVVGWVVAAANTEEYGREIARQLGGARTTESRVRKVGLLNMGPASLPWALLQDSLVDVVEESGGESAAFAVIYAIDHSKHAPSSPIEHVWLQTIGRRPIPFDPQARAALTEEMRVNHPDLARHIAKWEALKAAGSPWTKP